MKLVYIPLPVMLFASTLGCAKGVEAFAEEMCACTDSDCVDRVVEKYKDLPETQTKIGDADKLPEDNKAAYEKAVGCAIDIQLKARRKTPDADGKGG